ncbi:cell envelope-related function transcriptional attenuator common domain-containing protein [Paramicrobacterium humi]|uniref:Cell envelope-related function transcriptional attenuator common domain-containing protein n=1 Tax=Paramicrobacterium humi TaxID=640635 RepID=A0A1H4NDB5_9MICO|nr:LCP family protein [Microbacterium humi]SEB92865.1 cell envelope-related function transcriptional attenuator common domain-containing protein [Microbacterium humi]
MTPAHAAKPGRHRKIFVAAGAALLALLLAICVTIPVDYLVLNARIDRSDFPLSSGPGETWVIIGSDSRDDLPDGRNVYGTTADTPGQRADVILVVHKAEGKTSVLSLPRDLVAYNTETQGLERLALSWRNGPDEFVSSLCDSLGVNVSHLIIVTMAGFASIVDAVGGVEVNIEHPLKDAKAGLDLPHAGPHVLDGKTALALVRSRHPIQEIDGDWRESSVNAGSTARTEWAGRVFAATMSTAKSQLIDPLATQNLALAVTNHITTDRDTSLADLLRAWPDSTSVIDVPAQPSPGVLPLQINQETLDTLAAAGFKPGQCHT